MLRNSIIISLFLLMNVNIVYSQIDTKKIKPIESTISDVERILGKTKFEGYFARYESEEGIYYIDYSDGKCNPAWEIDWNIPKWTVEKVYLSLYDDLPISSLGINLKKLKKINNSLDTDNFEYIDKRNGISYGVQFYDESKGYVVNSIETSPGSKYRNLLCRK